MRQNEHVQNNKTTVKHVIGENAADILIKRLYKAKFGTNRDKLSTLITVAIFCRISGANKVEADRFNRIDDITTHKSSLVYIKGDIRVKIQDTSTHVLISPIRREPQKC